MSERDGYDILRIEKDRFNFGVLFFGAHHRGHSQYYTMRNRSIPQISSQTTNRSLHTVIANIKKTSQAVILGKLVLIVDIERIPGYSSALLLETNNSANFKIKRLAIYAVFVY